MRTTALRALATTARVVSGTGEGVEDVLTYFAGDVAGANSASSSANEGLHRPDAAQAPSAAHVSSTPHYQTYNTSGPTAAARLMRRQRLWNAGRFAVLPHVEAAPLSSSSSDPQRIHQNTDRTFVAGPRGPLQRASAFDSFSRLFDRYVERGFTDIEALIFHPDAPAPAAILASVLAHRTPCLQLTERALMAIVRGWRGGLAAGTGGDAAFALQRVAKSLAEGPCALVLYSVPSVRALLVEALLCEGLFADALRVLDEMPDEWITAALWAALVDAATQSKLPDSHVLWRLLSSAQGPREGILTRAGESMLLRTSEHGPSPGPLFLSSSRFEVRLSTIVSSSVEPPATAAAVATARLPAPPEDAGADESRGGASALVASTAAPPPVHWCALGQCEVGYALSHYAADGSTVISSVAAGDGRGFGRGRVQLFDSADVYLAQRETMLRAFAPVAGSGAAKLPLINPADAEREAIAVTMSAHGVIFGLDAKATAQLLLRVGVSFGGQASPLLALHILRRYIRTCHLLRDEVADLQTRIHQELARLEGWRRRQQELTCHVGAGDGDVHQTGAHSGAGVEGGVDVAQVELTSTSALMVTSEKLVTLLREQHAAAASAAALHPAPFHVFFKVLREARDVLSHSEEASAGAHGGGGGGRGAAMGSTVIFTPDGRALPMQAGALPMVHWEVAWHYFQLLNRDNPHWYTLIPEDAGDLCLNVLEMLCHGAEPWMCLNVARSVSARHIVDGLEMSLWLLHRLDPSHHTEEACQVARKLFRWLLVDVGVHLQPRLQHHLIPVARVLTRLGLQEDLTTLYNAVLDNVYSFPESFREEFMRVMADLVCPACQSLLPDQDVFIERDCPNCMATIPAKDPATTVPSFQLSSAHIREIRERRRQQRQRARRRLSDSVGRLGTHSGPGSRHTHQHQSTPRAPGDIATTHFKRMILQDAKPLLPGVSVSSEVSLFPLEGGSAASAQHAGSLNVRAALEESTRRLELQEAARHFALAQRGVTFPDGTLQASLPSAVSRAAWTVGNSAVAPAAALPNTSTEGGWTCVWCKESNSEWSSRTQCSACGAETGPAAPWRSFAYAESGDAVVEVRSRIANCEERPLDAVVAAYLLMVYRRAFLLRATPHDHERIRHLVEKLCQLQERVLAGYVYMRLVPAQARQAGHLLFTLAHMFGGSVDAIRSLTQAQMANDDVFFETVFTPATCKVCFGEHDWKLCPIITRDFASTRSAINLSPEEKQRAVLGHLQRVVRVALEHRRENTKCVVDAYASFITSPFRELFAEVHAAETNELSMLLSEFRQYRRAALVLCHVPLHKRWNTAYVKLVPYFNVTEAEAMALLSKRSAGGIDDGTHPNFVQVTLTCCMCLDQRHASYACPRLATWLREVEQLATPRTATHRSNRRGAGAHALLDVEGEAAIRKRLKAQVDGWTSAGPERLRAFCRFLLDHVQDMREGSGTVDSNDPDDGHDGAPRHIMDLADPMMYALNRTIAKLATLGKRSQAFRLYSRTPLECLSVATTISLLRLNRFTDDGIRALLNENSSANQGDDPLSTTAARALEATTTMQASPSARAAAVPLRHICLLCAEADHAFVDCPELSAQATPAEKLLYAVQQLGSICSSPDGVGAAAAYVYHMYNRGQLHYDMLRDHPELVRELLTLVRRCCASRQVGAAVRVLRRLPIEVAPPGPSYKQIWRAAGLPEEAVESRYVELLALYDAEGLRPSIDNPPPRQTLSTRFMSGLNHALHDDLCRHCYQHDHALATCPVFHAEVSFGRDYVAAYRMSMMSEQLTRDWQDAYLLKLVTFFKGHQIFMPYHIAGVANALNAIAAMWCFRGEPGIAMRHLLWIPPAYRRRQTFRHILHSLRIPSPEIHRALEGFYFSPTDGGGHQPPRAGGSVGGGGIAAHHLMLPRPAIKDTALKGVFEQFPTAMMALAQAEERMQQIWIRNHNVATASPSATGDAAISARLGGEQQERSSAPASSSRTLSAGMSSAVMQCGDITALREDFDPILTELEDAVGMKLGSRHILFTSAVDVLAATAITNSGKTEPTAAAQEVVEVSSVMHPTSTPHASRSEATTETTTAAAAQAPAAEKETPTARSTGPQRHQRTGDTERNKQVQRQPHQQQQQPQWHSGAGGDGGAEATVSTSFGEPRRDHSRRRSSSDSRGGWHTGNYSSKRHHKRGNRQRGGDAQHRQRHSRGY